MTYFADILIILALRMTFAAELECSNFISCPCGNTGEIVSVCVPDAEVFYDEVCTRLSKCLSCEKGSNICSKCPEGFGGPLCSHDLTKIRQKRQISLPDRGPRLPRAESGSTQGPSPCPFLDASNLGSIHCVQISSEEEFCTGKCWPGYHFPLLFTVEMNLTCYRGVWRPHDSFPICKKNPVEEMIYCRDPGTNANSARQSKTPSSPFGFRQGSRLKYSCDQGYDLNGERTVFCLISGEWSSSPPRCIAQSTAPKTPDKAYCPDPGIVAFSSRRSSTQSTRKGFVQNSRIDYSCDENYNLSGQRRIFCLASGEWTDKKPRCIKKPTTPDIDELSMQEACEKASHKIDCADLGGGYKCLEVGCPASYVYDLRYTSSTAYVCKHIFQQCNFLIRDCLNEVKEFTYLCGTLKSNQIKTKSDEIMLFEWPSSSYDDEFELLVKDVLTDTGVEPATRDHFQLRKTVGNNQEVYIIKNVQGKQAIELNLIRKTYRMGQFMGTSVGRYLVLVL